MLVCTFLCLKLADWSLAVYCVVMPYAASLLESIGHSRQVLRDLTYV